MTTTTANAAPSIVTTRGPARDQGRAVGLWDGSGRSMRSASSTGASHSGHRRAHSETAAPQPWHWTTAPILRRPGSAVTASHVVDPRGDFDEREPSDAGAVSTSSDGGGQGRPEAARPRGRNDRGTRSGRFRVAACRRRDYRRFRAVPDVPTTSADEARSSGRAGCRVTPTASSPSSTVRRSRLTCSVRCGSSAEVASGDRHQRAFDGPELASWRGVVSYPRHWWLSPAVFAGITQRLRP